MKNPLRLRLEYQPPQSVRVIKLIDKSVAAACPDRDDGRYLQRQTRVKRSLFRRSRRRPKPRSYSWKFSTNMMSTADVSTWEKTIRLPSGDTANPGSPAGGGPSKSAILETLRVARSKNSMAGCVPASFT